MKNYVWETILNAFIFLKIIIEITKSNFLEFTVFILNKHFSLFTIDTVPAAYFSRMRMCITVCVVACMCAYVDVLLMHET